jgi:adenylate cyclase class 2
MNHSDKELEVKFYITRPKQLEQRLDALGGKLSAQRVHEVNLRFDTPELALLKAGKLLRLRQDTQARVTFKGLGSIVGGARLRQELEFVVSDFKTAQATFEALGYQVTMMYEKHRTMYRLGNVDVTIDEMPYGDFAEIEGLDGEGIQAAAGQLGLDWDARILDSYVVLFDHVREVLGLTFRDLSFEDFRGITVTPDALGVKIADQS